MPVVVQICVVIVTLAIVAIVTTTILAMIRHGKAAERFAATAQVSLAQVDQLVREAHELMLAVRELVPPAQRVVQRFERIGDRAADLSTVVLDEIETPVLAAAAVARGVKAGSVRLIELLSRRFITHVSTKNGDQAHE